MSTKWLSNCVLCITAVVIVTISAETGGYFAITTARGCGTTDLNIVTEQPIASDIRIRYAKTLAGESDGLRSHPRHPAIKHEWHNLVKEKTPDEVFFAFSTKPAGLFGSRHEKHHYADRLIIWYEHNGRDAFREILLPHNTVPGP